MQAKKIALFGIFGALAPTLSLLELLLFPAEVLPLGVKLGLSNIVTTYAACTFGVGGAFAITLMKAAFTFLLRGGTAAFLSLSGGLCATAAICLTVRFVGKRLSFIGVSLVSAALHHFGQLAAAILLSGTISLLAYGKWLLLFSVPAGLLTGTVLNLTVPRLQAATQSWQKEKNS